LANEAEASLQTNTGLTLVIAANYGGQWDITESAKKIAIDVSKGLIAPDKYHYRFVWEIYITYQSCLALTC
jgi:undecaprenyl diphosphate synthase